MYKQRFSFVFSRGPVFDKIGVEELVHIERPEDRQRCLERFCKRHNEYSLWPKCKAVAFANIEKHRNRQTQLVLKHA